MAKKRKSLNKNDLKKIALLIRRQELCGVKENHPCDPDGHFAFANTVACRNIREGILQYLEEHLNENSIPYLDFIEWNDKTKKEFKEKHSVKLS